jgi:hypothetical protein
VTFYTAKKIHRRQLRLGPDTFIMGDMDAMHGAMQMLGITPPPPNDYPECLSRYLHRRVWRATLGDVEHHICEGDGSPLFAKPSERRKKFTGRVFDSLQDFCAVEGISRREPVWCSEDMTWKTEYRVYVIGETILAMDHYSGDSSLTLDRSTVEAALRDYRSSGTAPAAYGIDFGVLSTGETALVEANDGYALGAYEIDTASYTDLLFTRWRELLEMRK